MLSLFSLLQPGSAPCLHHGELLPWQQTEPRSSQKRGESAALELDISESNMRRSSGIMLHTDCTFILKGAFEVGLHEVSSVWYIQ